MLFRSIGPLADTIAWDWYGGTPPYKVTPLDGIKAAVGANVKVNYAADETGNAAVNAARNSDIAVVVIGNSPTCGPDMILRGARFFTSPIPSAIVQSSLNLLSRWQRDTVEIWSYCRLSIPVRRLQTRMHIWVLNTALRGWRAA